MGQVTRKEALLQKKGGGLDIKSKALRNMKQRNAETEINTQVGSLSAKARSPTRVFVGRRGMNVRERKRDGRIGREWAKIVVCFFFPCVCPA